MNTLKNYLLTLNLFRPPLGSNIEEDEHQQRTSIIATRVYLILLILILLSFSIAISVFPYTTSETIENPTLTQFELLPDLSQCPCSHISLSYGQFISTDAVFHQICSSEFILDRWINALFFDANSTYYLANDIRSSGYAQFQALASFCRLSRAIIDQSQSVLSSTLFITPQVFTETILRSKVKVFFDQFQSRTSNMFRTQIQLISEVIMSNADISGLETSVTPSLFPYSSGYKPQLNAVGFQYEDETWCFCIVELTCRAPMGIYNAFIGIDTLGYIINSYIPTLIIPGLSSGCLPVDALLQSSLACFFNQTCVDRIVLFLGVSNENFTAVPLLPSSSQFTMNSSVQSIVDQLMMEQWEARVFYNKYYSACAPLFCIYSIKQRRDFLYVFGTIIGLLSGLTTALSIIIPLIIGFLRRRPSNNDSTPPLSVRARIRQLQILLKRTIVELNLFKQYPSNDSQVHQQCVATRFYILFLVITVVILTLYSSLTREVYRETLKNPTEAQFITLQSHYPTSLQCPCSSITISFEKFITIEPQYHQICLSDFVSSQWIDYTNQAVLTNEEYNLFDYRASGGPQFQLLTILCQRAKRIVDDSLERFLQSDIVTSQVIPKDLFVSKANISIQDWKLSTVNEFFQTLQLIQAVHQGNQLMAINFNLTFNRLGQYLLNPWNFTEDSFSCECIQSPSCHIRMGIYDLNPETFDNILIFAIPGFYMGCFQIDALLQSTMECFYAQTCMNKLASYLPPNMQSVNFSILNASMNLPNETIDSIASRLFVDNWSSDISFTSYYKVCLPNTCTFEYIRRHNILFLITTIISVFGGLTTGLKILIFIILRFLTKIHRQRSFLDHLRSSKLWFVSLLDKEYLPRRLHFVLLITTLIILCLYSSLTRQPKIEQISKPVLYIYKDLFNRYLTTLHCPCSQVSIEYQWFLNLSSVHHQVCSSDFVSPRWISFLYGDGNLTGYPRVDFRATGVSHFQLLAALCQLTKKTVEAAVSQFHTTTFINSDVLSIDQFNDQINLIISQFQTTVPNSFLNTFDLVREMINSNKLMTIFATNWEFSGFGNGTLYEGATVHTKPLYFNASCNCGLSSQCVEPARLDNQTIEGLLVGCYPLEALLQSSLQCFYNLSCLDYFHSYNITFTPLNISLLSHFKTTSTIGFLISELMVEQWSSVLSYDSYFALCAPTHCSYSYIAYRSTIDVITNLIGFYGGLVIIFDVIVHVMINLWELVRQHFQRRRTIHPINS